MKPRKSRTTQLAPTSSHPSEMEADEELETMMLSLSPSKLLPRDGSKEKTEQKTLAACPPAFACHLGKVKAPAAASQPDQSDDCSTPVSSASGPASLKPPLPVPPELLALKIPLRKTTPPLRLKPVSVLALLPGTPAASSASSASPAVTGQSVLGHPTTPAPPSAVSAARDPPAQSHRTVVPPMPSYEQDMSRWNCSHQQRIWMKTEMESLGLWPGSRPVRHPMNMISLWCNPPQPELIDSIYELPSPKYFQLHPFFIWKPISQSNKAETVLMSTPGFLVYQGNTSTVPVKSSLCTKQKE
uniref:Uncharacterized protein n=1 Tax=Nothobranchius rachovii TaxID=451742 RepID=A0A1A8S2C7_9TELE